MMIIREILRADLDRAGMTQGDLARRLNVSQQAVGLWMIRNRIPGRQVSDLVSIFGPDSEIAKEVQAGTLQQDTAVSRTSARSVPGHIAEVNHFDRIMQLRDAEQEMTTMLAAEMPGIHFETWVETGPYKRRFDYVTSRLVVEVAVLSVQMVDRPFYDYRRVSYKIQDLAVTRALHPKRHYVLIVVIEGEYDASETAMNRIRYDCLALGIKALRVENHLDAARLIIEMERPELDLPDSNGPP